MNGEDGRTGEAELKIIDDRTVKDIDGGERGQEGTKNRTTRSSGSEVTRRRRRKKTFNESLDLRIRQ